MTYDKKTNTIRVSPGSDFLVDSGVFWIHTLKKLSKGANASQGLQNDWKTIESWLGCEGRELTEADEQKIGKAWRAYLAIGLAPSFALQPAFDFISNKYKESAETRPGDVAPVGVMDVFDRLHASEDEISAKRAHDIEVEKKKFREVLTSGVKHSILKNKLASLSRTTRILVVLSLAWSVWVIFRTSGYYELFGHELERWKDDMFFANLLLPPIFVGLIWAAYKWVAKASN